MIGGKAENLIQRVCVERLGSSQDGRKGFQRGADEVIVRLLRGERAACRLRMEAHPPGSGLSRLEAVTHNPCPHPPCRPQLCDFFKEVNVGVEEEGKSRCK